jgi:hypothetical protein
VRFQVLTAESMKFRVVFWDVLPYKIIVHRHFRGTCCLHLWWWIAEDNSELHTLRRENLKSHIPKWSCLSLELMTALILWNGNFSTGKCWNCRSLLQERKKSLINCNLKMFKLHCTDTLMNVYLCSQYFISWLYYNLDGIGHNSSRFASKMAYY